MAIFMTLNSLVSAYIGRAASLLEGANDFAEKSRKLKEELKGQYHETKERIEEYEKFETAVRRDLELPEIRQAKNLDKNSMLVQFNQATEDVWGELRTIANRRGVELPDRLKLRDFGHEPTDGPTEFRRYYDYLAIVRRSLIATLEAGVAEIQRIELVPGDLLVLHDLLHHQDYLRYHYFFAGPPPSVIGVAGPAALFFGFPFNFFLGTGRSKASLTSFRNLLPSWVG